jgi:hypothetical protein
MPIPGLPTLREVSAYGKRTILFVLKELAIAIALPISPQSLYFRHYDKLNPCLERVSKCIACEHFEYAAEDISIGNLISHRSL